jgi:5'-3' exonuclease
MLYRIAYTTDSDAQAQSTLDLALLAVMRDTNAAKGYVAVKGKGNFRHDMADDYKANRSKTEMDPRVKVALNNLYEYCWATECVQSHGCEADDVVSIWATEAEEAGDSFVIAHVDKDIDMVPGWHYNFNKKTLYHIDEEQGHYLLCKQLLTGDSSDNIQGLKGIGPKTAEKLLANVRMDDMLDVVRKTWRDKHPQDWQEKLQLCFNLIYMRRSFDGFQPLTIEEVYGEGRLR